MTGDINLEKRIREEARWHILRILDAGRPVGVNAAVIVRLLEDSNLSCTPDTVRRELDYLQGLGLIEAGDDHGFGKLTAHGVAVVEYNAPAPAGIARPKQRAN
jgi:hypothetical protein